MIGVNLEHLLIGFFGSHLVPLLFINNGQVKQSSGIFLLGYRYLQVADCPIQVLINLIEQDPKIEVSFKVLRVLLESFLVKRVYFVEQTLSWEHGLFDACC